MQKRPNNSRKFLSKNKPVEGQLTLVQSAVQTCPFRRLIEVWLDACRANGRADKTLVDYTSKIYKFYWWWSEHTHYAEKLGAHPKFVTTKEAREFAAYLREGDNQRWGDSEHKNNQKRERLSPVSVASYGRAVKIFFNWLEEEGHIEKTPFNRSVKFSNQHKKDRVLKTVAEEDLKKIFAALSSPEVLQTFLGRRNLAMVALLLDSGIRRGELLSLRIFDIDLEKNRCIVRGKTGQRVAIFDEQARSALANYIQWLTGYGIATDSALWLCEDGEPLSYGGFGMFIRRLEMASGVDFHAHKLRHTFATMMARQGIGVFDLKEMLGHESITTTQIYVQQNIDHLAELHRTRSPLSTLAQNKMVKINRRGRPRNR
jgi:integrase/recombinase XerD